MPYEEKDPMICQLLGDFERLWHQVVHLTHVDDVFWQVGAILQAHPDLDKAEHPTFQEWMLSCYAVNMVVGLRALIDTDSRALSLLQLLGSMEKSCKLFTRTRHHRVCGNTPTGFVDKWFDKIAGTGEPHIPVRVFRSFKKRLRKEVEPLKRFADQKVAHLDRQPSPGDPTTNHVRSALCSARYVLEKCTFILDGGALLSSVPEIQDNWLSVFRVAWLPKGSKVPSYKHLDQLYNDFKKTIEAS